jgi:hypothetical protein
MAAEEKMHKIFERLSKSGYKAKRIEPTNMGYFGVWQLRYAEEANKEKKFRKTDNPSLALISLYKIKPYG